MKEYEWLAHYKTTNYYDSRKEVPSPPGILKLHTLSTQYKVGCIWLLSWDKKDGDSENKNVFGWRDRNIKIHLFLEQFWSEFLYFQNMRYREDKSQETIFIIFISKISL